MKITAGRLLLRLTATILRIFRCRLIPWGSGVMNVKVGTRIKTQYFGPNSRFTWYYQYQLKWGSIDWFWCEHFFWFRHIATAPTFLNGFGSFKKQSELQFDPNDVWSGWLIWLLPIRSECYLRLLSYCEHMIISILFRGLSLSLSLSVITLKGNSLPKISSPRGLI